MTEVQQILDELARIDETLAEPGAAIRIDTAELDQRRRRLEARFDDLRTRPDYLAQVTSYAAPLGAAG